MKTTKMKLALFAVCGFMILPNISNAYEVTAADAVRITDDTILFTITYKFGFLNRDLRMPIVTTTNEAVGNKTTFEITSAGEPLADIAVQALVLSNDSDVTIENGQYYLPRRENAEFTLLAFATLAQDTPTNALQLAITNLPYTMIDGDTEKIGAVLPEELPEYRTPFITLANGITITASMADVTLK